MKELQMRYAFQDQIANGRLGYGEWYDASLASREKIVTDMFDLRKDVPTLKLWIEFRNVPESAT